MSKVVEPDRQEEFKTLPRKLIITENFYAFQSTVKHLLTDFPLADLWVKI